jgi:hypothetical protein
MSIDNGSPRLTVAELAARCRGQFIPLTSTFSYFCTPSMAEEDLRQYLHDPIAALSPAICADLGKIGLVLVPYLEKGNGRTGDLVGFEKPAEGRQLAVSRATPGDMRILVLATKEEDVANYHYTFYNALAALVGDTWQSAGRESFYQQLREELSAEVHGEVDERSWHLKQSLVRRQANIRKETKLFRDYARQAPPADAQPLPAQAPGAAIVVIPAAGRLRGFSGTVEEEVTGRRSLRAFIQERGGNSDYEFRLAIEHYVAAAGYQRHLAFRQQMVDIQQVVRAVVIIAVPGHDQGGSCDGAYLFLLHEDRRAIHQVEFPNEGLP